MPKPPYAQAFSDLEHILEQAQTLTSDIIGKLQDEKGNLESGLNAQLMQQVLLRGELLHEANQMARSTAPLLDDDQRAGLAKKLSQINHLHEEMGTLLEGHRAEIKAAMAGNNNTQEGMKAYQKNSTQAIERTYLEDA